MKAAVLEATDSVVVKDVPTPECPADSVLVRVDGCAVSQLDMRAYRGIRETVRPPVILGRHLVGTIVEVGAEVRGYYDSERVTFAPDVPCGTCYSCRSGYSTVCEDVVRIGIDWDGGFAEYMVMPGRAVRHGSLNKVPDGVSTPAASLAQPLATCINAQAMLHVGLGDRVLVIGCGPLGCLHAMLAHAHGATRLIMADVLPERLSMAGVVAADRYVNTTAEDLTAAVKAYTDDRGADVVIVACEAPEAQQQAISLAAPRGRICFFAGIPDDPTVPALDRNRLRSRELTVVGSYGATARHNYKALQLIRSGQVNTEKIITHRFGLDGIVAALDTAESKGGLKVLVGPSA